MLDFLRNFMLSFDAPDGGGGGGGTPDIRAAVTDLGGVAPAGEEPDIFEGGDDASTTGQGTDDSSSDVGGDSDDTAGQSDDGSGDGSDNGDGQSDTDDQAAADNEDKESDAKEGDQADDGSDTDDPNKGRDGKTPEQIAADKKAADAKKPLTEEEKAIEATLQEAYRSNPALKAALKAYPQLRGEFFRAASINKLYPGGIKEATQAKEYALELFKIDNLYYGTSPQS